MSTTASQQSVRVPEPDLTPEAMIERATALQPRLRAEQDETERRGRYSEDLHQEFRKAGFYRCLQPRRFGGYEFDAENLLPPRNHELSRGDPSVGWGLLVGAGHTLMLGSYFSEEAQAEGFGPTGDFAAPSVAAPSGTATPTDGGWLIKGKWGYASGAPYATHFMPSVLILSEQGPPRAGLALIPRSQWKMLDDWGAILGMRGSGSNSIEVEQARVPKNHVIELDMLNVDVTNGTPGARLHGNPMYAGRCLSFFRAELDAILVGVGYAAIDEYENLIRTKKTLYPPMQLRYLHHDYQRHLGLALGMLNAAKRLVITAGDVYMDYCRRGFEGGKAFSLEEDLELVASLQHAGRLSWEAIELLVRTSSSSAAKDGERMQRYVSRRFSLPESSLVTIRHARAAARACPSRPRPRYVDKRPRRGA